MTQDQSEDTANNSAAAAQPAGRRELRASVLRLLRHAIQEAVVGIDSDFVNKIVPVLSKDERNLNDDDEKTLWLAGCGLNLMFPSGSNGSDRETTDMDGSER